MSSKEIDLGKYSSELSQLYSFYTYSKGALTHPTSFESIVQYETKQMIETMKPYQKDPGKAGFEDPIQSKMPEIIASNIRVGLKILLGLLFESAFSSFEKFLNNVVRTYYWTFPQVLKNLERKLDLKDVIGQASMETLLNHIIEQEIDYFSHLSLNSKKDYLKNKFGLESLKENNVWVSCGEEMWKDIDKKRQIIVHKESDPNIDEAYFLKSITYLQRAMLLISTIAQVKNGISFRFYGLEDSVIKKTPASL